MWPPSRTCCSECFHPNFKFARISQLCQSTIVVHAKSNYVKHNGLVRIWLIRRLLLFDQLLMLNLRGEIAGRLRVG